MFDTNVYPASMSRFRRNLLRALFALSSPLYLLATAIDLLVNFAANRIGAPFLAVLAVDLLAFAIIAPLKFLRFTHIFTLKWSRKALKPIDYVLDKTNNTVTYALDYTANIILNRIGRFPAFAFSFFVYRIAILWSWEVVSAVALALASVLPTLILYPVWFVMAYTHASLVFHNIRISLARNRASALESDRVSELLAFRSKPIIGSVVLLMRLTKFVLMLPFVVSNYFVNKVNLKLQSRNEEGPRTWHLQRVIDRLTQITQETTQGLEIYLDPRELVEVFISASANKDIRPVFEYLQKNSIYSGGEGLINFDKAVKRQFAASSAIINREFWARKRLTAAQVSAIEHNEDLISAISMEAIKIPVTITIARPPDADGRELGISVSRRLDLCDVLENMQKRAELRYSQLDPLSNLRIRSLDQIKFDHTTQAAIDVVAITEKWQEFATSKDFAEFFAFLRENYKPIRVERPLQELAYKIDLTWPNQLDAVRRKQIANADMPNDIDRRSITDLERSNPHLCCEISGRLMRNPITINGHHCDLLEFIYKLTRGELNFFNFTSFDQVAFNQALADEIAQKVQAIPIVPVVRFTTERREPLPLPQSAPQNVPAAARPEQNRHGNRGLRRFIPGIFGF